MEEQIVTRVFRQQNFVHYLFIIDVIQFYQGSLWSFIFNQLYRTSRMRAKSAMPRKVQTLQQDLEHQTQKEKILDEDRRLFLRQAEQIKQKYKQEIEKLKNENKKLKSIRDEFISSKKNRSMLSRTAYGSMGSNLSKIGISNTDENYLRITLDKEKHNTRAKKNMLFNLQDKLKEVEDNKLGYIEESPLMRNIRVLENRLDKVMIKYNESQSIQQTYEQVVKRLKEERVGYDSQLAAIETCLKGKEHDFEELLLLAHDATHAKEGAFAELKRFQQRRVTVQEMRSKYVNEKKDQINKEIPNTSQNFHKPDRSFNPKATAIFTTSYKHDENYQRQQLSDYQEAFRKLKEITGVIDANQIIQKFKTQGLTTNSLEQLKENYRKKIEDLKDQKDKLKEGLDELKYIHEKEGSGHRRLDEIETEMAKLTNQYERTNLKTTKLESSMINIKAGINHLKEQVGFYKTEKSKQFQSRSANLDDDLKIVLDKLRRMYDVVRNDPNYAKYSYKANATTISNLIRNSQGSIVREDEEASEDD